ncbi:MAG: hypothetical protein V3U98_09500 [Acidobacteriota bacterium]
MKGVWRRIVTWGVGVAVVGGGITFCLKLYEFVRTANSGEMPGFAFATVISYFIVTAGFLCLVMWAFLRGHYHDIEEPKYRLLQTEASLDRLEASGTDDKVCSAGGSR